MHRTRLRRLSVAASLVLTTAAAAVIVGTPAAASNTYPAVVVAMGDSITRAPLAAGPHPGDGHFSWSTGDAPAVDSHRARLEESSGSPVTARNVAVGGSTSSDLPRQAELAVGYGAQYVTLLSGANNICQAESVAELPAAADYAADLRSALSTLEQGVPEASVLVASVPSLARVHAAGVQSVAAITVWQAVDRCAIMLADPLDESAATQDRRAAVEARVVEFNAALAAVCAEFARCFTDGGAVYENEVTLADLSPVDYFHPSVQGQAQIASATWEAAVAAGVFAPTTTAPRDAVEVTIDNASDRVVLSGAWRTTSHPSDVDSTLSFNSATGASYSLTFTGTSVQIVTRLTPTAGIGDVEIDGVPVGSIDGYAPRVKHGTVVFASEELTDATHVITVTGSGRRNASSGGHNLILDAFVVSQTAGPLE